MNRREKIKDTFMNKKKLFGLLFGIELCLLIVGIAGLFGKDDVYRYDAKSMTAHIGEYSEEVEGYYIDSSSGMTGTAVELSGIALPKGVYTVALYYETDTFVKNLCDMQDNSGSTYNTFRSSGENLYVGLDKTGFQVWALTDKENLSLLVTYGGEGSLTVKGLEISESNALYRIFLFLVIVGSLIVDICVFCFQYDKIYGISGKDKNVTFGIILVVLVSSIPLMMDRMIYSGDLIYHLMRIVGIKDGLLSGQFPVRIAPEWQHGYGYASSIFYGETLIYAAALFRLIGFSVLTSYRLYILLVNVATALAAYYCFKNIFKDKYVGLLCSAVYTISIYRISKTFVCGSLGETLGILLLPWLVYGFFRVFSEDINAERYKRAWIPLTIGFTGLVQSHLLSGELAGFFTILLCLIMWKKVFRPKTFIVLAKTVIYSVLLSFWFLVPFADYMLRDDFVIKHVSERTIQYNGLYLAQMFFTYFTAGTNVYFEVNGMANAQPMGVGIALWLPLIIFAGILFFRRTEVLDKAELRLGKITAIFGGIAMLMSLSVFPWDRVQFLTSITKTLVSSIQYPDRFLTIANVCFTAVFGVVMRWIVCIWKKKGLAFGCAAVSGLLLVSSVYLMNNMMSVCDTFRVYDEAGIGKSYISGGEYVPYGANASQFMYKEQPSAEDNIAVESYEKNGLTVKVLCSNSSDRVGVLEFPLLYYRGYRARDMESGEELTIYKGSNCVVGVAVPAGYKGMIKVSFESPWYWRVAEVVSVVTFIVLCVGCYMQKRKARYNCKPEIFAG